MIHFKDKTFCSFDDCSKFNECTRALTKKVESDAEKIGLPISIYLDKPECYESINKL